jgi:hypothetical protein
VNPGFMLLLYYDIPEFHQAIWMTQDDDDDDDEDDDASKQTNRADGR